MIRPALLFCLWSAACLVGGCSVSPIVGGSNDGGSMDAPVWDVGCPPGQVACNGRCRSLSVDPANCGACGVACGQSMTCVGGACQARCPVPQSMCGSQCVSFQTDARHCGACDVACPDGQVCSLGHCGTVCDATLATCGGGDDAGATIACVDLRTDRLNCGACGRACAPGEICVARACQTSCPSGQTACGQTCRDLQTDDAHCGSCDHACLPGNTCSAGVCAPSCGAGLTACAGVCTNLATDNASCGACGTTCPAGQVCTRGVCGTTCAPPLATCTSDGATSCADTALDPAHCGDCGTHCDLAHASAVGCSAGACTVVRCAANFGDCDGDPADGCETSTLTDPTHCGGCGRACALSHATSVCDAGACTLTACAAGYADCDGVAANGCEVHTDSDNGSCGACGVVCPAGRACVAGACEVTCSAGLAICGGACVDTAVDPSHCGSCATACALAGVNVQACVHGACVVGGCAPGFGDCDGVAANGCEASLATDGGNCGACASTGTGHVCASGRVCAGGVCVASCGTLGTCGTGLTSYCADFAVDPAHCGGCATACALDHVSAQACTGGACVVAGCAANYANCNGAAADGCETSTAVDAANCGRCGVACSTNHVTAACAAGVCNGACAAGYGDCNANKQSDGCEVGTASDPANCGACGAVCPTPANATAICAAAVCGFTCDRGYARRGSACVALTPPRPLAPMSTATVTSRRPTLRWALVDGDGVHVDLCRDRALTAGCVPFDAAGTSGAPVADLAAGVWFWRLNLRLEGATTGVVSPTWQFTVGARTAAVGATPGPDTSAGTALDLNGDGYADVAVGAPSLSNSTGSVFVYPGSAGGTASTAATVLTGPDGAATNFGGSVASGGDVNGDGFADLIVGAFGYGDGTGRVYVFPGSAGGVASTPAASLTGPAGASSDFARSLAGVGDVNGDGYADVVVGADRVDSESGRAYVYLGSASGLADVPAFTLGDSAAGPNHFGGSVAGAGDVNGDGLADLVVGAEEGIGRAYVYLGGASGLTLNPGTPISGLDGDFSFFGQSVSGAGDVNGDGYSDVLVGAYGALNSAGRAYVFLGHPGGVSATPDASITGLTSAGAGRSGAGADLNGDGYSDVLVGAYGPSSSAGQVYVYLGRASGLNPTLAAVFTGFDGGAFGVALSSASDVNGDGFADLVVGAQGVNFSTGRAYVYFGTAGTLATTPGRTLTGPTRFGQFGYSVASRQDDVSTRCVCRTLAAALASPASSI